ncbi:WecB/TagA/CpsF family glycosyltransferase [Aurantibacter crassamenti]|uniref:WecB/TagA/CpsF family glycosyltransferase n=1 Tax=Aurantibacter crassamenti TaxID=1837375 RepID=UPI001939692D|nr:WecB/TagA/CpsF family glycosyltransferase [Aurantibacter crassamenti]MBM1105809.1 WecB/TagA/CpsF family glycosyltransferase [Aurantibacter crassamenti]
MQKEQHIDCLGYQVFEGELSSAFSSQKTLVNTINQYSYCIAKKDDDFSEALKQSDILLPDGVGIVIAAKLLYGKKIRKIAGADIHQFLLNKLNSEHGSCFYLGSSENTLSLINTRLSKEYPNIKSGFYSPPYKAKFSAEDNAQMTEAVNKFKPDVLFVGMTAPKQEKWSYENKEALDTSIICSIGAVFDFYAGTMKRPNKIWIDFGLEWLGRLFKEPKRMWKRYIYYGAVFAWHLTKALFKKVF